MAAFFPFPTRAWCSIALGCILPPLVCAAEPAQTPSASHCGSPHLEARKVASVVDGRTLKLADGREVRLAGIEFPGEPNVSAQGAVASLRELIADRTVTLRTSESADRYGRLIAFAFIEGAEPGRSIQEELVLRGNAFVSARVADAQCYIMLRAAERSAREQALGFWRDPIHGTRAASKPDALLADLGRFAIVEGKIVSVREVRGITYLNFGRRWSEDFTVAVRKRHEANFVAALQDLKKSKGQVVRVRGWVEARGGPWIEAEHPHQIEIVASR